MSLFRNRLLLSTFLLLFLSGCIEGLDSLLGGDSSNDDFSGETITIGTKVSNVHLEAGETKYFYIKEPMANSVYTVQTLTNTEQPTEEHYGDISFYATDDSGGYGNCGFYFGGTEVGQRFWACDLREHSTTAPEHRVSMTNFHYEAVTLDAFVIVEGDARVGSPVLPMPVTINSTLDVGSGDTIFNGELFVKKSYLQIVSFSPGTYEIDNSNNNTSGSGDVSLEIVTNVNDPVGSLVMSCEAGNSACSVSLEQDQDYFIIITNSDAVYQYFSVYLTKTGESDTTTDTGSGTTSTASTDMNTPTMLTLDTAKSITILDMDTVYLSFTKSATDGSDAYGVYLNNADVSLSTGYVDGSFISHGTFEYKDTTAGIQNMAIVGGTADHLIKITNYSGADVTLDATVSGGVKGGSLSSIAVPVSVGTATGFGVTFNDAYFKFTAAGTTATVALSNLTEGVDVQINDTAGNEVQAMTTDGVSSQLSKSVPVSGLTSGTDYAVRIKSKNSTSKSFGQLTITTP